MKEGLLMVQGFQSYNHNQDQLINANIFLKLT